jgi:hypothetical protein
MNRRERPTGNKWVNQGQQRNPSPRFASRYDGGEVPDPLGSNDWDGQGNDPHGDAEGYGEVLA